MRQGNKGKTMTDLRQTIREAAERQGVNQCELARAAGVTRQTIRNWQEGRNKINADAVERMMERLGLVVTEVKQ
jgi:transcriptional regulator with XRE-family HTH domain